MPEAALSQAAHRRTLMVARANLPAPSERRRPALWGRLATSAVPSALISPDLAFLADACARMGRGFGA